MYRQTYNLKLGKILMESDGEVLTGLWFFDSKDNMKFNSKYEEKNLEIFEETKKWLDIYFSGKNPDFTPKYRVINSTPFREEVTKIMEKIPFGEVITYNDIAKEIARGRNIKKMSAQAVGGAVGANPICIIIPCHRVVGSNGNLTGYGGGIKNKIKLLEIEGNDMSKFTLPKKGKLNEKM